MKNANVYRGFTITHQENVVTVTKTSVHEGDFDRQYEDARAILGSFPSSNTNIWGTDGVGYMINKKQGLVRVCKSTVGPRQFRAGLVRLIGEGCKG